MGCARLGRARYRQGEGIIGGVAKSLQSSVVRNVNLAGDYIRDPHLPKTFAELAIPVKTGNHFLGVLDIRHSYPDSFSDHDIQLMATVADQIAVAIEKAQILCRPAGVASARESSSGAAGPIREISCLGQDRGFGCA